MRRFTRGLLRKKLNELSEDYNSGRTYDQRFSQNAGFFLSELIPLIYDRSEREYKILYQSSIIDRLIPEDDENAFDLLNEIYQEIFYRTKFINYTNLPEDDERVIMSSKIMLYLKMQGYVVRDGYHGLYILDKVSE